MVFILNNDDKCEQQLSKLQKENDLVLSTLNWMYFIVCSLLLLTVIIFGIHLRLRGRIRNFEIRILLSLLIYYLLDTFISTDFLTTYPASVH